MKPNFKFLSNILSIVSYLLFSSISPSENKLERNVAKWLNVEKVRLQEIHGGLTNQTFLASTTQNKQFVVRMGKKNSQNLGINRFCEYACNKSASKIGVAPKILYYDPKNGILITSFIKGKNLTSEQLNNTYQMQRVIDLIKKYHAIPFKSKFKSDSIYEKIRKMIKQSLTYKNTYISKQNIKKSLILIDLIESYFKDKEKKYEGLCHCDLFPPNFIDDGKHLWLIDWEYACWGNILFDLADLCIELSLDKQKTKTLLKMYFGPSWQENYFDFKLMRATFNLRNAFWYEIRGKEVAELGDFNMKNYAKKHFKLFIEEIGKLSKQITIPND